MAERKVVSFDEFYYQLKLIKLIISENPVYYLECEKDKNFYS
jgi:hypothetical protein